MRFHGDISIITTINHDDSYPNLAIYQKYCLVGFVDKLPEGRNTDIELVTSEMKELWVMNLRRFNPILV